MKIYLIKFNWYEYEDYNGFVVIAKNKGKAILFLKQKYPGEINGVVWRKGYKIKELIPKNYKRAAEIIGSFNAG